MVIFSGDQRRRRKLDGGCFLAPGYTVTPLWERILG